MKKIVKYLSLCGYAIQYGCVAHCTLEYIGDFVICSGPSMEPQIHTGDIVLTDHLSVTFKRLQRGDVIIARSPSNPSQFICKRIKLVEGDRIIKPPQSSFKTSSYVPKGHVWLEGDNKENSTDSRMYGPVPYGLIRSKVFYRIWPAKTFGAMKVAAKSEPD